MKTITLFTTLLAVTTARSIVDTVNANDVAVIETILKNYL